MRHEDMNARMDAFLKVWLAVGLVLASILTVVVAVLLCRHFYPPPPKVAEVVPESRVP